MDAFGPAKGIGRADGPSSRNAEIRPLSGVFGPHVRGRRFGIDLRQTLSANAPQSPLAWSYGAGEYRRYARVGPESRF